MTNMLDWLAHRASVSPQKVALIYGEQRWTYDELNNLVAGMAGQLAAAGVEAGQHVAALMPNRVEYVCLIHAPARLGAVLVPLNIRLTGDELRRQVDQADCSFVICVAQTEAQAVALACAGRRILSVDPPQEPGIEALSDCAIESQFEISEHVIPSASRLRSICPSLRTGLNRAKRSEESLELSMASQFLRDLRISLMRPLPLVAQNDIRDNLGLSRTQVVDVKQWQSRPVDLEAVQGIVYTSGTTGHPKGAMLTFGNHLWSATASAFRLGTDPADRWLVCMPLYHVGGIAIVFRCCLYGTTMVLQNGFDPPAISRALDTQQITLVSLVPTMLHRLLESHKESFTSSTLRCILLGGAAATPSLLERCRALNLPVATTYGLTEAASQVATASPVEANRKPGSVGKPLMFSAVEIVGKDGQELAPGEIGEIVVRGPTVMQGYYNHPEATQKSLRDGQLHTGDMGYLDEEGDLWIVQRRADLIVSGGENVYPTEVEQVLSRHPAVVEACAVGVEDAEWGQRVAVAVVINGGEAGMTEQRLVAFCRERLAGYKQPRLVRFVDALPRTASGKVRRDKVRELVS